MRRSDRSTIQKLIGRISLSALLPILVFAPQMLRADTLNLTDIDPLLTAPAADYGFLTGSVGGAAFFIRSDVQTSGTGVSDPFLIMQNNGTESGYNTDGTLQFDTKQASFTRDLQISELAVVPLDGVNYYQFNLNANQDNNLVYGTKVLSIDQIKIYTSPTASISTTNLNDLGTLRFDLGPNVIFIDANIGATSGIGSSDMYAYIPVSAFAGAQSSDYLYFFNENGATPTLPSDDGQEQWAAVIGGAPTPPIPEPGTLILLGTALSALALVRRKK